MMTTDDILELLKRADIEKQILAAQIEAYLTKCKEEGRDPGLESDTIYD
jgi:hypothetical protein